VGLEYGTVVRSLLNAEQGSPLHPPGLRMAEALADVYALLQRNPEAKNGDLRTTAARIWPDTGTALH